MTRFTTFALFLLIAVSSQQTTANPNAAYNAAEEHATVVSSDGQMISLEFELSDLNRSEVEINGDPSDAVSVTVDGRRATFKRRTEDRYVFEYKLTGEENGGKPGPVDVAAAMEIPKDETTTYRITRDAALIVNHSNPIACAITSHRYGDRVGGIVFLDVSARHAVGPEKWDEGRPPIRIIKTELRHVAGNGEVVEDADVHPPFRLRLDTTRYANGPQTFKVVAYDTVDRRGEEAVRGEAGPGAPGQAVQDRERGSSAEDRQRDRLLPAG